MEAKKWGFAITLTFIIAILPLTLQILEFDQVHYAFMGGFKNIIIGMLGRGFSSGNHVVGADKKGTTFVVSPNLSTCHQSYGRVGLPVYCCPPKPESDEAFVDFQFPDPSLPLRLRRPAHLADDNYIAKYNKAISIMKSLPFSDPRSFTRQANLHCLYCTKAYNQQHSNSPLQIHRSWLFFPWHRMMLYFHERILGSLIGDETFALPFWNWDSPDGMMISELYTNEPFVDKQREISHFPPQVVDLDYSCTESKLRPQDQIDINMALMYNRVVSGAKKMELFMGCPYKAGEAGSCDRPGTIEQAPHNTVHKWVGSNKNPGRENMGVFYSAARDPIFYPHHTNIDRLWEVWRGLHRNKLDITDSDWLDSHFFFHDENLRLVRIKIRDVLNITKLRYAYEKVDLPWLNMRPKPSLPPKIARYILNMREDENGLQLPSNHILLPDFRPYGRILDTSITVKVNRPIIRKTKEEKEEEEEVIVVHGIDVKDNTYVKFDVYVNVVDETLVDPGFREFAGTYVHIPPGVGLAMSESNEVRRKTSLKLGISELLEDLEADGDEHIWVTLLPRTESCINTTIDGIRIEFMR